MIRYSLCSKRGDRPTNQDNLGIAEKIDNIPIDSESVKTMGVLDGEGCFLFYLADGCMENGGRASSTAIQRISGEWKSNQQFLKSRQIKEIAFHLAMVADEAVCSLNDSTDSCGSTLLLCIIKQRKYCLLNVGDSPGLLFRSSGQIIELGMRHNLANLKERHHMPVDEMDFSTLLHALGQDSNLQNRVHFAEGELENRDTLLLCTDGLTQVSEQAKNSAFSLEEIQHRIQKGETAVELVCNAAQRPGSDNTTAIILQYFESDTDRGGANECYMNL